MNSRIFKYNISDPVSPQYADTLTAMTPEDPAHWLPESSMQHLKQHARSRSMGKNLIVSKTHTLSRSPTSNLFGNSNLSPSLSTAAASSSSTISANGQDTVVSSPLITASHTATTPEHHPLEKETNALTSTSSDSTSARSDGTPDVKLQKKTQETNLTTHGIVSADEDDGIFHIGEMSFEFRVWQKEAESMETNSSLELVSRRYLEQHVRQYGVFESHELTKTEHQILANPKEPNFSLSYRWLTRIPLDILSTNHITHLDLSNNYLISLPGWFFEVLKSLSFLNLSKNFFFSLPDKLGELKKLKELNLSHNRLEYLPTFAIFGLTNLQMLNVSHNILVAIPNEIIRLNNSLTELNFSHNFIVDLPPELRNLKRLKYLNGSNNYLLLKPISTIIKNFHVESRRTKRNRDKRLSTPANSQLAIPSTTTTTTPSAAPIHSKDSLESVTSSAASLSIDASILESNVNINTGTGSAGSESVVSAFSPGSGNTSNIHHDGHTDDDDDEEPDDKYAYNQAKKHVLKSRTFLLLELLESEKRFVQHMNVLFHIFFLPMKTQLREIQLEFEFNVLENDIDQIVPNEISAIITVHRSFLIDLQSRLLMNEYNPTILDLVCVSDLFSDRLSLFEHVHASYVPIYEKAIAVLHDARKQSAEFDKFLISRRRLPVCGGMDLDSLLALPLHRLRKYNDYLKHVEQATPEIHDDKENLKKLISEMNGVWRKQNENIFYLNNRFKIAELQQKFKSKTLPPSDAVLIREGKLTLAPSREVQLIKKDIIKRKKKNSNSYIDMVKNINITMEDVKKFKLEDVPYFKDLNIWDMRLTEISVVLYLFKDCMIIKENHLLKKLVGKINKYDLHDAEVDKSEDNDKEFIVRLRDKNRYFAFICKSTSEMMSWYDDFFAVICDTQKLDTADTTEDSMLALDMSSLAETRELDEVDQFIDDDDYDDMDFYNVESDDDGTEEMTPRTALAQKFDSLHNIGNVDNISRKHHNHASKSFTNMTHADRVEVPALKPSRANTFYHRRDKEIETSSFFANSGSRSDDSKHLRTVSSDRIHVVGIGDKAGAKNRRTTRSRSASLTNIK